jgi:hypothetical protein
VRLAGFSALALGAKWQVLGQAGLFVDAVDAEHCSVYEEAARLAVAKFHELPFWNPYYCGGITGLGTPSARFASPTFLLTLLFGTLRAAPLTMLVMTVVGLEGAFRYIRAHGGGAFGAFLAAPIFAICGCFARWPAFDWTHFYGFQLVPWVLLGVHDTFKGSRRGVVVLAVSMAWMIGFGGTYAAPLTALAAAWEAGFAILGRIRRLREVDGGGRDTGAELLRVAWLGAAALVFVVAMSLVRLWPIAETLGASPRVLGGSEGTHIGQIWRDLFGTEGSHLSQVWHEIARRHRPNPPHAEYYVGIASLPIFLVGCLRRRALPFILSGLLWVWLSVGYQAGIPLFALLRMVPPFTMLRAPERVLPMFVLSFAVVAALALRRFEVMARKQPRAILLVLACLLCFGQTLQELVRNDISVSHARKLLAPPAVVDRPFRQTRGNRWASFYYMEQSRGTLACFDDYNVAQSTELRGDLPAEEYLRDPTAGKVTEKAWAPNRLDLHVDLSRATRLYVNQNWHPGWHASEGTLVDDRGLLAIDLPEGSHDVVLRFLPRSGIAGGLTSLAALLVAVYVWRNTKKSDAFGTGRTLTNEVGLFASPLLVAALGWAVLREPRRPPIPLVTPEGNPVVAPAPPADATRVDARWEAEGITLEAVRVRTRPAPADGDTDVTLEFDWRFSKKPPPGLAVSVLIDGTAQGAVKLDYAFLSDVLLIDDAPLDKTLRDVSETLTLARGEAPLEPRVQVALYYARRDGKRLSDVQASGAPIADGRVQVATFKLP